MMEELVTHTVRVLQPQRPRSDPSQLAQSVYAQMRRDFMVAAPFALHAEIPELLAAAWALVRETLFAGQEPRAKKEIVAAAVSASNECALPAGTRSCAGSPGDRHHQTDVSLMCR